MNLRLKADLLLIYLVAATEALLLTRLVLKLFAARPNHPVVSLIFTATSPLVRPLASLDASQPRFGAILEFSSLACAVLVPLVWIAGLAAYQRISATRIVTEG